MFENAGFETESGKPRYKNFDLDMCLTSRSLDSRLTPLLLSINIGFQLESEMVDLQGLKPPFPIRVGNIYGCCPIHVPSYCMLHAVV